MDPDNYLNQLETAYFHWKSHFEQLLQDAKMGQEFKRRLTECSTMKAIMQIPGRDVVSCDISISFWRSSATLTLTEEVTLPKGVVIKFVKDKSED